jgi:isopenicillin N synthase-like dioxygenase
LRRTAFFFEGGAPLSGGIAVIDLARQGGDPGGLAAALRDAFESRGFVGVRGHGIPDATIAAAFEASRAIFALDEATKRKYEVPGGAGQRGYTRLGVERAKDQTRPDLKEFWHVGREVARDHPLASVLQRNLWPAEVPRFRAAALALFDALERLGARLLAAVARSLDLDDGWFAARIDHGNSILRAIHYPPIGPGVEGVRAAAHEDINLITLLVGSGEPGLEIRSRDGRWIVLTTLPDAIVCNVGDMLQRLTNLRLVSTTHRVVNPPPPWDRRSRFSIPFFLHFNPEVVIETLPSCIDAEHPDRFPEAITANEYLQERLREIGLMKG